MGQSSDVVADAPPTALERHLASRIEHVELSIRTKMLELAATLDDVIALGRGDPDFDTPEHIVAAAQKALAEGAHHYTGPTGLPQLRNAVAEKLRRDNNLTYEADEVIICNGCQEALFITFMALLNPGDEVLVQAPRFNAYDHMIELAGGKVVTVPTYEEDDFALRPAEIETRITPRTKVLAVVTPNNPTGGVIPRNALREIARLAVERDLIVISDEIYEKLIYDDLEHVSLGTFPGTRERTVTINGFSKAYAMTGWRVGYLAAPRPFVRAITEVKHTISISTPTSMQLGALAALEGPEEPIRAMRDEYDRRRRFLMAALDEMGISYGYPGGAMYIYANISSLGMDSEEFCYELLRQAQVMIFPGTLFGDEHKNHIRISLLAPLPRMVEAVERMKAFVAGRRSEVRA
ncbi:MAG: pyridoxal phosphate-dependent aminotransferase [Ardenticatenaceae bacterium]|nr:pyridoxal phosphate-dependent aminotransferase [Ardenticatenaceae bacterium]